MNRLIKERRKAGSCKDEFVVGNLMDGKAHKGTDKNKIEQNELGCKTYNVVYGIECGACGKIVYVGETSRTVK